MPSLAMPNQDLLCTNQQEARDVAWTDCPPGLNIHACHARLFEWKTLFTVHMDGSPSPRRTVGQFNGELDTQPQAANRPVQLRAAAAAAHGSLLTCHDIRKTFPRAGPPGFFLGERREEKRERVHDGRLVLDVALEAQTGRILRSSDMSISARRDHFSAQLRRVSDDRVLE
ncbi:hypothetical protein FZEAL_2409 [Fusarium zealandicum]|uniref:Uncharacterized protein n=1 Tax=Fusarium zealandicum TaxID=1053134 RepID=A0A8H4XMT4_9HYPO|nr:hypothetical protein FZEAL_2409 [Fusarium zealandicum]